MRFEFDLGEFGKGDVVRSDKAMIDRSGYVFRRNKYL